MTSIDDVARLAGVSTATVSRALNGRGKVSEGARQRVRDAASALGYVASASASSLASGRTRNVGVLVPFVGGWFFGAVLEGVTETLAQNGYDVTLYAVTTDAATRRDLFQTFLRRHRVDAVLAISLALEPFEVHALQDLGIPVVAIGGPQALPALAVDEDAVARLAASHLIGLGHREIAHIGVEAAVDIDFRVGARRHAGFEAALTDAGIPLPGERVAIGDFTVAGGYRAAAQLLAAGPVTAVFAASDEMAIGALQACRDAGLSVPGDVSIVGVDGHELAAFFDLTSIDQYPTQQGRTAASAVLRALDEDAPAPPVAAALPFALIERGSTAPPR
ncbi:LacI family transcriptional regulator [Microbacterium mangrovi]|uniref:LacI family transcriptional regulator n=1 Tax=Microbacterium mangrovi TaxID=1348253 RepID=A0A0B2A6E9_9MICO|nr:LacI family DNA-binding transcriptional regulator [Microbacterium mangrovi]KHK97133.1 LacI family transcriptional regulator [Microbacterium mangrovi]